jgi:hypothetical protein
MGNIIGELGTEIKRLERIINNNVSCLFTNLEDLLGELKFMVESIISFSEEDYCQELNELRIKSIDIMERIECLEE